MGLGFYSGLEEEKKSKGKSVADKVGDSVKGFFSHPSEIPGKVTDTFFGGTKKFAGTVKAGAGGAYGLGKVAKASLFDSDEDYKRTVDEVDKTLNKDLEPGKTFFKDSEEAENLDTPGLLKKSVAAGTGVATEVVPFARGASLVKAGGSFGKNLARSAVEGAGYGAAGAVAEDALNDEDITLKDTLKGALLGGAGGAVGFGVGKGIEKGAQKVVSSIKPVHALEEPNALDRAKNALTGNDVGSDAETLARLQAIPRGERTDVQKKQLDNLILKGFSDVRSKFPDDKSFYDQFIIPEADKPTRSADLAMEIMGQIENDNIPIHEAINNSIKPDLSFTDNYAAARSELVDLAHRNKQPQLIKQFDDMSKGMSREEKTDLLNKSLVNYRDRGGMLAEKYGNTTPSATDLTTVNTHNTTPQDAKKLLAAVSGSKEVAIKPLQRAKTALTGEAPKSNADTPVGKGAESIAQKLDEQLATFDERLAAPEEVMNALTKGDAVTRKARSHEWLDRYEDTLSVLGRHFGGVGTDLGYKLAEGAKKVSDIQEVVRPSIDKTKKLLDGMSKSKAGRADIQSRVYDALEDRANADAYLKTPQEKELFDETVKVFDFFKQQREATGKSVIAENYSPRAAVSNALDAPERLLNDARTAFSTDVDSRFSKKRSKHIEDADINRNIIDLLPMYASSQSKEFGYEGAMKFAKDNLSKINPAYIADPKSRREGEEYLRTLMTQVLDPPTLSKFERAQNKLIAQTYKANLGWSPKYALQNMTQRFATKAVVTKEASKLAGEMDKTDVDMLRKGLLSGDATVSAEATNTAESLGAPAKNGVSRFEPGAAAERGNVHGAFDQGVAQAVVESKPYKEAIRHGFKPQEAAKMALQDETIRDLAIRRGNIVVNDTQFGANFVTKPEFFREAKSFFGLSDKWYKQYQRFSHGMIQNMSTILRANDARAMDILKRGDPRETKLVDFKYSAEALHNGVDDLIKGIKNGEIHDVSLEMAEGYQKTLATAIKALDKGMKARSQVRGGKTAKSVVKMWAAASAIQWMFDGGFALTGEDQSKELSRAAQFGSPFSIPTRDQNLLAGAAIPSSPFKPELQPRRLLNFVPGVGMVANRGREINRFVNALTGDTGQ